MTRREMLALMATLPFAARLTAQTRATGQLRIAVALTHGLLIEPAGTLKSWWNPATTTADEEVEADPALGLGRNGLVYPHTLYPVAGISNVVAAAAGPGSSFAVVADGRVLAWGRQAQGLLGTTPLAEYEERAQPLPPTNTPTPVAVRFDAVNVSHVYDHVLALTRTGTVYAWGNGSKGQLGIGPLPTVNFKHRSARVMPDVPYPVLIRDLTDVTAIATGNGHSLALLKDGTVRAWGENTQGQLGDGSTINRESTRARARRHECGRHRRRFVSLTGRARRRHRHGMGRRDPAEGCTLAPHAGAGCRGARYPLGRRRWVVCRGDHRDRRCHDVGLESALRDGTRRPELGSARACEGPSRCAIDCVGDEPDHCRHRVRANLDVGPRPAMDTPWRRRLRSVSHPSLDRRTRAALKSLRQFRP